MSLSYYVSRDLISSESNRSIRQHLAAPLRLYSQHDFLLEL